MSDFFCKKLNKNATKMKNAPIKGILGEKILNEISKEAWDKWIKHQTILINEYRLNLIDKKAREFLLIEMKKFLFNEV